MPALTEVHRSPQPVAPASPRPSTNKLQSASAERPPGSVIGVSRVVVGPAQRRASKNHRPWSSACVLALVCVLGSLASLRTSRSWSQDGAEVVPILALLGIMVEALRWRPDIGSAPTRPVSPAVAVAIVGLAVVAVVGVEAIPAVGPLAIGPIISLSLVGTYLAVWGHRRQSLLRAMSVLSLLTWQPAAEFVHRTVRSTLEQPSSLLYRRLAQIPLLEVSDEPWRLFSAELHRGSLVVIASIVLGFGVNRWRLSWRTMIDLVATVTGALTIHHIVILRAPIDQFAPTEMTQLITNPTLEVAIAVLAVLGLGALRSARSAGDGADHGGQPSTILADRDPVIFEPGVATSSPLLTMALLSMLIPLVLMALVGEALR